MDSRSRRFRGLVGSSSVAIPPEALLAIVSLPSARVDRSRGPTTLLGSGGPRSRMRPANRRKLIGKVFVSPLVRGLRRFRKRDSTSAGRSVAGIHVSPLLACLLASALVLTGTSTYSSSTRANTTEAVEPAVLSNISVGSQPYALALDASGGTLFVANMNSNNVSVISTSTNRTIATASAPGYPDSIAYDSRSGDAYVGTYGTSGNTSDVSIISGATDTNTGSVQVGGQVWDLLADASNGFVYAGSEVANSIFVISDSSKTITQTLPYSAGPTGDMLLDPANGDLYFGNATAQFLTVVSGSSNNVLATVPLGGIPTALAYDPISRDVDVAVADLGQPNSASLLQVISGANYTVLSSTPIPPVPQAMAYDPLNRDLYISNYFGNVTVVSTENDAVVAEMHVGDFTFNVAVDTVTGDVAVTSGEPRTVTVISGSTNTVTAVLSAGGFPASMLFDANASCFYVAVLTQNDGGAVTIVPSALEQPSSGPATSPVLDLAGETEYIAIGAACAVGLAVVVWLIRAKRSPGS